MKKRVLSFVLALLMLVMVPAETAFAMPAAQADLESIVTLTEEVVTEDVETPVEEETTSEEVVEEVVEPTEAPVEEATVEPTEASVEEATAEPTAEPEVEATVEPTEAPEVTPEATVEPTPVEEATAEPTEEPAVEATEEPTAEPTEEPTATPTASPSATPAKKDVQLAGRDLTAKVVGSNGIQYEGVTYLSVQAVNSLPSDSVNAYIQMCDEVASLKESGADVKNAVIALNEQGELLLSFSMPTEVFFTSDVEVVEETEETVDDVSALEEEVVEEVTEEPAEAPVEEADVATEVEETIETEEASEVVEEVAEVVEDTADVAEESMTAVTVNEGVVFSENMELALANNIPEETIGEEDFVETDTKITNANYFMNQLTSTEKKIYKSAKSAIVSKGKNAFTYKGAYVSSSSIANAISALVTTYPAKFDFRKPGGETGWKYWYQGGKWNYNVTIEKSKYYSKSLETQAKNKVKALVKEANTYATNSYPGNHVYGMIKYFDSWIRQNNYYNNIGTSETTADMNTAAYYYCHSSYGVLLKGYGVCESYALAMTRLLDAAGIRNIYVTGYAGGGHAWNHVQMPNGSWYLLDSTWNDNTSSNNYLLIGSNTDGNTHQASGAAYSIGMDFKFYALAAANYSANTEKTYISGTTLNKTKAGIKPGATLQLKGKKPTSGSNYYYSKYAKAWSSSNTAVATVSKTGKVKAIKPGTATISYSVDGVKVATSTIYVYQFTKLTFADNNKTSYKYTWGNKDTAFTSADAYTVKINVNQKNKAMTAASIQSALGLAAPTVKSSKPAVAAATASLSGDVITLSVTPKKIGTTKLTVTFGGKTATYNLTTKYQLQSGWFNALPYTTKEYTGAAFKPAVTKTATAPKNLKYSVSYKNNKNVGTATVTIKGTGNYTGTITKTFKITAKNIASTAVFKSCTASKTYNGKAQKATTVVKLGKKTLKAGTDYEIRYNNSATAKTNVGKYTVSIVGKGNYAGTLATTKTFEIKKIKVAKVKFSCPTAVKYTGSAIASPVKVKIGKTTLTAGTDYTVTYYNAAGTKVTTLKDKGKYKAVITPKGSNIDWGTKTQVVKNFTIKVIK